jgi:ABC-type phosphate transport system ATPase subunit
MIAMDGGKVLVNYDPSDNLKLQYNGLDVIEQIPNEFGIIVIAAVGPGRCGKSSLLNQLIRKGNGDHYNFITPLQFLK